MLFDLSWNANTANDLLPLISGLVLPWLQILLPSSFFPLLPSVCCTCSDTRTNHTPLPCLSSMHLTSLSFCKSTPPFHFLKTAPSHSCTVILTLSVTCELHFLLQKKKMEKSIYLSYSLSTVWSSTLGNFCRPRRLRLPHSPSPATPLPLSHIIASDYSGLWVSFCFWILFLYFLMRRCSTFLCIKNLDESAFLSVVH